MAAKEPKPRVLPKAAEEEVKAPEVVKEEKKVEAKREEKRQEPKVKKEEEKASSQPLIDPKKFEEHRRQY